MIHNPVLRPYQKVAADHILTNCKSALFLDMGMGKTLTTLSVLNHLVGSFEILRPLVIAPKMVTEQTWFDEIAEWPHLSHLRLSVMAGSEKKRIAALEADADMWAISRDNIRWLVEYCLNKRGRKWPFDMLVIDELSSFKNRDTRRWKALKKVVPHCRRVVGLTGTPVPNGLHDLWAQVYLLDRGERLGRTLTQFRRDYFFPHPSGFGYILRDGADALIKDAIKDICIYMSKDEIDGLVGRIDVVRSVHLESLDKYKKFERESVLKIDQETGELEITPMSAGALYNKLLQYANGAVYDSDKVYHKVDGTKLDALAEAYEELQGRPVIIFYAFQSDLDRIKERIKDAVPFNAGDRTETIRAWNRGEIPCLVMHPASGGHGLNLQKGGNHTFWYGLPWSLELYQQAVNRVDRPGQKHKVTNMIFTATGTLEDRVAKSLVDKGADQTDFLEAVRVTVKGARS